MSTFVEELVAAIAARNVLRREPHVGTDAANVAVLALYHGQNRQVRVLWARLDSSIDAPLVDSSVEEIGHLTPLDGVNHMLPPSMALAVLRRRPLHCILAIADE